MDSPITNLQTVKLIRYGLYALGIIVAAPLAVLLIKGIVGFAIAAILGLAAISFAPAISMKFANYGVKAVVSEAQKNPIETLYNQLAEKEQAAGKFRDSITMFRTEVSNFETKTLQFKKDYPDDAPRFEAQLETMKKLLAFREGRYKQVQAELRNFEHAIQRAQALWDMSQSAQKMNKIAGMQVSDTFEKIKTDAAIDSVMTSVNKAFSEMETSLMENPEVQALNSSEGKQALEAVGQIGNTVSAK